MSIQKNGFSEEYEQKVIREVWERMGLEINFREGIDRIREVEEA